MLDAELLLLQERLYNVSKPFILVCSKSIRKHLIYEGYDPRYGARHIRRAIDRFLVKPLSSLIATSQIGEADTIIASFDGRSNKPIFKSIKSMQQVAPPAPEESSTPVLDSILKYV